MSVRRTPLRADLTGSRSLVNDAPSLHSPVLTLVVYNTTFEQERWNMVPK